MSVYQYMCNGSPRRRGRRKREENMSEEIMAGKFPTLMKTLIYKSNKPNRYQVRLIQKTCFYTIKVKLMKDKNKEKIRKAARKN